MNETAVAPRRDSYLVPWIVALGLAAVAVFGYRHLTRPAARIPHSTMTAAKGVEWFFVLRMPAVTSQYESGIETMKARYGEWLDALTRAGYRPILFSEARRILAEGGMLPPKSVALVFDPGFRRTHKVLAPILETHRWPAVWFSDEKAMQNRHREYITYHTARGMVASGLWDVGLKKADGGYDFSIGQTAPFVMGDETPVWSSTSGGSALNRGRRFAELQRLNVNSDWLPSDLLNRLNAELPVEEPVFFNVGRVQNLIWGTTAKEPVRFDLAVRPARKDTIVSWLGTAGIDNCRLEAATADFSGSFALRFRWDEVHGDGIQIAVSRDKMVIEEWVGGTGRLVYRSERPWIGSFKLKIALIGDRLMMSLDDRTFDIARLQCPARGAGVTQIYLFDRIRDVARVKGLQLFYEPLPQSSMVWPPSF